MGQYYRRFGTKKQSPLQRAHLKDVNAANAARRSKKKKKSTRSSAKDRKEVTLTPKTLHINTLKFENEILKVQVKGFTRQLHNVKRRLLRSNTRKKTLQHTLRDTKQKNKELTSSAPSIPHPLPPSTPQTSIFTAPLPAPPLPPSSSTPDDFPELTKLQERLATLRKEKDALRKRVSRGVNGRSKAVAKAVERAKLTSAMVFFVKNKGIVTTETRRLIRKLVQLSVPFANIQQVITRVLKTAGVQVVGSIDRRTVRRVVREGKVYAELQMAHELKEAPRESLCYRDHVHVTYLSQDATISGDGTSHKAIQVEAAFITIPTPSYVREAAAARGEACSSHQVRVTPVKPTHGHSADIQLDNWKARFRGLSQILNDSPLGENEPDVCLWDLLGKIRGMLSDHANDQKSLAAKFEGWKRDVDREKRGQDYLDVIPCKDRFEFFMRNADRIIEEIGGALVWEALPDEEKRRLNEESTARAVRELGQERFETLSEEEKRWTDLFIWGGCGMHKVMNTEKWGASAMEKWWTSEEARALGADQAAPVWLYNKANAAIVADKSASSSREEAERVTKRGGVKTTDLAGSILRHKDYKKGQQDNYRWFFALVLGYMVQYPDTSNTRFCTHGFAAAELLVHLAVYIEFLILIQQVKDAGTFTNIEHNLFIALQDPGTLVELAVLAFYSQSVTLPYLLFIRGSTEQNLLLLGPFHAAVIRHCQKIADDPEILLSTDTDSYKQGALNGQMWERPEAIYAILSAYQDGKLPYLKPLISAYFRGAIVGWERFTTEFAPGGRVDSATGEELAAAHMRPTNDHSEGILGSWRQGKLKAPAKSQETWNASAVHQRNHTEDWEVVYSTPEVEKFVKKRTREEDTGRATREMMKKHVETQKEKAVQKESGRQEQKARKDAKEAKFGAMEVNLDPEYWRQLGDRAKLKDMQTVLTWLRLPSRKVKVPAGMSSLKKDALLGKFTEFLDGLGESKREELATMNALERSPAVLDAGSSEQVHGGENTLVVGTAMDIESDTDDEY